MRQKLKVLRAPEFHRMSGRNGGQPYPAPAAIRWTRTDADEIEQGIIRAYFRLAGTSNERNGSRTVTVIRAGAMEARLTEAPSETCLVGMPSFWLEIYSHASRSVVASRGCSEFDEDELAAAVELIARAGERIRVDH
ncbi:hypothetical protein [Microvirga mediterraneensis]|uniref:Uncharacterized protein n=1 Tax=Microvirga mediterraneensis TaxID=2754695 RepID=A0A838BH64_9HYPH|nr:hypothetical protein [Microvirga mediterraneensis]MBA1154575.1 hypothetical protein [Microvirga mediterraneensis]